LTGWITVEITEKRRTTEWIDRIVELADVHYTDADRIRVVMDQLNTHKPAAFYQFFPPEQARAYLDRFEFHYTPKRGSWLNMAEIEIGVLKRQCLDVSTTQRRSTRRSLRGKSVGTRRVVPSTGSLLPTMLESSSASSIQLSSKRIYRFRVEVTLSMINRLGRDSNASVLTSADPPASGLVTEHTHFISYVNL
jgi:hypothetical protein